MSDMNMYNILGKFNNVDPKMIPAKEDVKAEPVYENVEPRGSIMEAIKTLEEKYQGFKKTVAAIAKGGSAEDPEAVAAAIGRKKYGKEKFQKAAAAGKKLGEAAKPDYIDLDKDGDKKESMKKAAKDAKKKTDEAIDPELLKAAGVGLATGAVIPAVSNLGYKAAEKIDKWLDKRSSAAAKKEYEAERKARLAKKSKKVAEGEYDPAPVDPEAVAKRKLLQALKDKQEDERGYDTKKSNVRTVKGKAYGGAAQKDSSEADDLDEARKLSIGELVDKIEPMLDHEARYKDVDWDEASKTLYWVTQETNDVESQQAAYQIAAILAKHGYTGWTVKVVVRDEWGGEDNSPWEVAMSESDEMDEASYSAKAARAGKDIGKPGKQFSKIAKDAAKRYGSKERGEKVAGAVLAKLRGKEEMDEVAPPGAKAERMVKHIKKGYAKDGKLTKKEKGIAYATAWKAHNKGQVEEGVKFGDTIKNSQAKMTKAKPTKLKESRVMEETDYFYEKVGKALAEKNPTLNTADPSFVAAVRQEMVAQGMDLNRARNIITNDEDFISDVATSYAHNCKEIAECGAPMNSFVEESPMAELDEIARLAGLPVKENEIYDEVNHEEVADDMDESVMGETLSDEQKLERYHELIKRGMDPDDAEVEVFNDEGDEDLDEANMGEGNEFSGALAQARAAGKKEFEVDGKKYTVKEDVNVNISANGEFDSINLIRQLAGLNTYQNILGAKQASDSGPVDTDSQEVEIEEERDVEYTNSPREETAGLDAAIPAGADLNRAKKQYKKEYPGDNPMAVKEEALWKAYESMINDVKL